MARWIAGVVADTKSMGRQLFWLNYQGRKPTRKRLKCWVEQNYGPSKIILARSMRLKASSATVATEG